MTKKKKTKKTENTENTGKASTKADAPDDRLPYETPRIIYREPLEAVTAVCFPAPPAKGNPGACPTGPTSS